MDSPTPTELDAQAPSYRCGRCGEVTTLPADVARRYCALCGCCESELVSCRYPASSRARDARTALRLPTV